MVKKVLHFVTMLILLVTVASAQVTTSSINGFVKSATGSGLDGATVTAIHVPTGAVYKTQTSKSGSYSIDNMNPGGPYTIEVTYVGLGAVKKSGIFLTLGESAYNDFSVSEKSTELDEVVVRAAAKSDPGKGGVSTIIGRDKMENMPTVGRNLSDYLRATPQVKLASASNAAAEGGVSIAGQNLRFNSFYVDGAVNNDVYGLSLAGTNGGQSAITPLSIDAIDQIQVLISPYDVSVGNFTGGAINAITKSGTNDVHGSAYYIFRNEDMAGRTPTGLKSLATKYPKFDNKTYGFTVGGPIIKNKLFYFVSGELQRDQVPTPFDVTTYLGDTKANSATFTTLTNYITQKSAGYVPGDVGGNTNETKSDKVAVKVDWNINSKNKLTASYRYTSGDRVVGFSSTTSTLQYANSGYRFPSKTNSASLELKSSLGKRASNRLLLTLTDVEDDRGPLGGVLAANVTIRDGIGGSIRFGTDASSTFNYLKQTTYNLSDQYKFSYGKQTITAGFEAEYYKANNAFIQNTRGTYIYATVADFLNDAKPVDYRVGFPLFGTLDEKSSEAAAKFNVFRGALFLNDEYKVNSRFSVTVGLRADYYNYLTTPKFDPFARDSALPKFAQYYDVQGAVPGQMANIPVSLSPRLGFTYKIPSAGMVIRGGAGLFSGRLPAAWPGGIYNNNGISQSSVTLNGSAAALNLVKYRPTPYTLAELGLAANQAKGSVDLIAKKFKMPKVFRTSLAIDKDLSHGWSVTAEGLFTQNINDISYQNMNLVPPTITTTGPGSHVIYGPYAPGNTTTYTLPIRSNGSTPYTGGGVYLISNQKGDKGYSYNLSLTINKATTRGFSFYATYNYGKSLVVNESQNSTTNSQWGNQESVNGRNFLARSISDNSAGHRVFAYVAKKFTYAEGALATTFSFTYTGQSGLPFSYIYSGQSARDGINFYDLVYVPTAADIQAQTFGTLGTNTPAQQKAALEKYIQNDKYLSSRRGQYTERNASRTQSTNVVDMRIAQDFSVKVGKSKYSFQLIYSMFNFTNFLDSDWGHQYQTAFDQVQLLGINYTATATSITPVYTFNPTTPAPGSVTTTVNPGYSSRWTSQLELRFRF